VEEIGAERDVHSGGARIFQLPGHSQGTRI